MKPAALLPASLVFGGLDGALALLLHLGAAVSVEPELEAVDEVGDCHRVVSFRVVVFWTVPARLVVAMTGVCVVAHSAGGCRC